MVFTFKYDICREVASIILKNNLVNFFTVISFKLDIELSEFIAVGVEINANSKVQSNTLYFYLARAYINCSLHLFPLAM